MNFLEALCSGKPFYRDGDPLVYRGKLGWDRAVLEVTTAPLCNLDRAPWCRIDENPLRGTTGWDLIQESPAETATSSLTMYSQSSGGNAITTWELPDDYLQAQEAYLGDDEQPACAHDWIDTGMRKSWCRHCSAAAIFRNGKWEEEVG